MTQESRFMTPDEVLHALRHFSQLNNVDEMPFVWPASEKQKITFETSIQKFNRERDSDGDLGWWLTMFFSSTYPKTRDDLAAIQEQTIEMKFLVESCETVGDLCQALSRQIRLTPLEEFRLLDRPCRSASIFLTLKRRLAARGMKAITPSTKVSLSLDLLREAIRIAPDRLPFQEPSQAAIFMGCGKFFGCLGILIGILFSAIGLVEKPVGMIVTSMIAIYMLFLVIGGAILLFTGWNRFPGIRTYRDLCKTLAGEPIVRRSLSVK